MLAHDPEKCAAVFLRDKRGTRLRGDHAQNGRRKRDGDFEPSRFTKQSRHKVVPALWPGRWFGGLGLARDPEKSAAVFRRDHAL
jgi:hypothetical protein